MRRLLPLCLAFALAALIAAPAFAQSNACRPGLFAPPGGISPVASFTLVDFIVNPIEGIEPVEPEIITPSGTCNCNTDRECAALSCGGGRTATCMLGLLDCSMYRKGGSCRC